jgi:hypothetical protein
MFITSAEAGTGFYSNFATPCSSGSATLLGHKINVAYIGNIFKGLSKPFYRWVHLRWKVAQFVAKT